MLIKRSSTLLRPLSPTSVMLLELSCTLLSHRRRARQNRRGPNARNRCSSISIRDPSFITVCSRRTSAFHLSSKQEVEDYIKCLLWTTHRPRTSQARMMLLYHLRTTITSPHCCWMARRVGRTCELIIKMMSRRRQNMLTADAFCYFYLKATCPESHNL